MTLIVVVTVCLLPLSAHNTPVADSVSLPDVEVSVSRLVRPVTQQQMQVSVIDSRLLAETQAVTPKDLSGLMPNVYMPDYGCAMTSSIYIRGLGSRINEPVLGMVVDGVPLTDKNMFDHAMQDIVRIELLHGPQGSLYGRNSPGGVMEIRTLLPLDITTQTVRGQLSYGTANSVVAQASFYRAENSRFGWGVAARYHRTDGFHVNDYTGDKIDGGQQAGGRIVLDGRPSDEWRVTGILYADYLRQGAFPYASTLTGRIAYNAPAAYKRTVLMPSVRARYECEGWRLNLSASYQMMLDNMQMDQDYTTADIFTLTQRQRQHNATLDGMLTAAKPCEWYDWQVGVSLFLKTNAMAAPVTFMRQGIDELILGNANKGIRSVFPDDSICISNNTLPIVSSFDMLNLGAAAYHQSHFHFGRWHINAGIRFDYECARMAYLSTADVHYRFTMIMDDYEWVHTELRGAETNHFVQVLPRLAVSYDATWGTLYGYAAKGYKAGGFNPQMFSTITQNQVMTDLAADMGMHLDIADPRYSDISVTAYRPEKDWTFELGAHFTPADALKVDIDVFHIQCFDQQVTIFPDGKTTGRMMANAARSRVWGTEAALHYRWEHLRWFGLVDASYGFTDARFIRFDDGIADYSGNCIPYAPRHTAHALVQAGYRFGRSWLERLSLSVRVNVVGPIYWNEQNSCVQTPYALMGANMTAEWRYVQLDLWGRNLTGTQYDVFYFRSMGNDFLQRGRPRELGATLRVVI